MTFARMIQHKIHIDFDSLCVCGIEQRPEIGFRAEVGIQSRIIGDIVAVIGIRRMGGGQPDCRHSKAVEIIKLGFYPLEISDSVAVTVGESVN